MGYTYFYSDSATAVTAGGTVSSLTYDGCIQADDGYGGTNHSFSIPGKTGLYHVHFKGTGRQVAVVRYKASSTDNGSNIVKWFDSGGVGTRTMNLKGLANYCTKEGYSVTAQLFSNLHAAINT